MNKFFILLALCFIPFTIKADGFWPEFKASYYHFSSSHVRKIVHSGTALVQGELNYRINNFILFVDAGYMQANGRSLGLHDKTELQVVPFSFGAKYNYCLQNFSVYAGAGVRGFAIRTHDHSPYVQRHVSKTGVGGVINAGLNYCWNRLVFNPFFEYNFINMHFRRTREDIERNIYRHNLDLSGFAVGAGVGYAF